MRTISEHEFKNKKKTQVGIRLETWNIGSLCSRGTEVTKELRKRKTDICGLQEVRWRGQGVHFIGVEGRRYKLWWSGNDTGEDSVGILVKEELCESVVEIRRRSDRIMTMCLIFWKEMIRLICVYLPQSEKPDIQKDKFYDELVHEWEMKGTKELTLEIGDFNSYAGKKMDRFKGAHGENKIGEENLEGRTLSEFCNQKDLYGRIHGLRRKKAR